MGFSKLRLPRLGVCFFFFLLSAVREGQNGTGTGVGCLLTNCRRRCQCLSARSRLTVCVTAYDTAFIVIGGPIVLGALLWAHTMLHARAGSPAALVAPSRATLPPPL